MRPCVTTTHDRISQAARRGVRFFPGFLVLPVGTQP